MAYSINFLSASLSGEPIPLMATGSPGTIIHTSIAGSAQMDEIFLYANNTGNQFYPLVLQVACTSGSHAMTMMMATQDSPQLVLQGWPVNQSATVRGYSPSGSGLMIIGGYVQRGP